MLAGLAVALAVGCASPPRPGREEPAAPPASAVSRGMVGRVVRVNSDLGYAIVHGRDLPGDGEEAKIYRKGEQVGMVRFAGPRGQEVAAPDILSGQALPGDRVVQN